MTCKNHTDEESERGTILVVENNSTLRTLYEMVLGRIGHRVHAVGSKEEALNSLPALQPTLILTSLTLPNNDAYDMSRRVRKRSGHKRVPIIGFSCSGDAQMEANAFEVGMNQIMTLPFKHSELCQYVSQFA